MQYLTQFANRYEKSLTLLLLVSGFFGAIAGVLTATWQVPIETAQVLLGLVSYDHGALPYAYHVTAFSMINHIGCLLLAITHSEAASSILLSCLMGIVVMQTVAMAIFLIFRNAYLAPLLTVILAAIHFMGSGIAYPIIFLGTEHTYGRAGLFFILYAALFLAFSRFKTGFLLSGLTLWIHPAWGLWLNMCLAIVLIVQYRRYGALLTPGNLLSYCLGVGLSITVFLWQKLHYPVNLAIAPGDASEAKEIFLNYIRYWDYHRQKFANPRILSTGFTYALLTFSLSALFMFRQRDTSIGEKLFYAFVMLSTILASLFVFLPSWFDPRFFPEFLVMLMPGRFINIPIFLCTPMLLGSAMLWISGSNRLLPETNRLQVSIVSAALLLSTAVFVERYGFKHTILFACLGGGLFWGIRKLRESHSLSSSLINSSALTACLALASASPLYLGIKLPSIEQRFQKVAVPGDINGSILTTMDNWLLQVKTRVSTITPHIDGYVYLGGNSLIRLNQLAIDIFGISLTTPPPPNLSLHQSVFATADFRNLWESRGCGEWEQLSAKYHFGLILVPATVHLQLQQIDNDPAWHKYRPVCAR